MGNGFMNTLLHNRILLAALLGWIVAQTCKTALELLRQRKLNLNRLVSAGGMPSSHAALVTSLATATGRIAGLSSVAFAISVVLAAIVMYDATGVRYAVSIQARILNQIIDEAFQGHPMAAKRLYEFIGHTPIEVLVGTILGIFIGFLMTI